MASWPVYSPLDEAVWVQALVGDIVSCSWGRHFTLTVPLSTQVYNILVPANLKLRWTTPVAYHQVGGGGL